MSMAAAVAGCDGASMAAVAGCDGVSMAVGADYDGASTVVSEGRRTGGLQMAGMACAGARAGDDGELAAVAK